MRLTSVLTAMSICAFGVAAGAQISLPARRAPEAPLSVLPALPAGADQIAPMTLELVVKTRRQTITRTADRIHVRGQGNEWLFVRNVRDSRRVSGTLVDHAARAIVFHDESDLRSMLGMNGWADALNLGFEPTARVDERRDTVDRDVLQDPAARFPDYKVIDLTEWLEGP